MKLDFRDIRQKDLPFLESTYQQNDLAGYASRFTPHRYRMKGAVKSPLHQWLGIFIGARIVGSVWVEKKRLRSRTGKLGILIHDKKYWSRGVGFQTLEETIPIFRKTLSLSKITLNVRCKNKRAIRCYEKAGFEIVGKDKKATSQGDISYFRME